MPQNSPRHRKLFVKLTENLRLKIPNGPSGLAIRAFVASCGYQLNGEKKRWLKLLRFSNTCPMNRWMLFRLTPKLGRDDKNVCWRWIRWTSAGGFEMRADRPPEVDRLIEIRHKARYLAKVAAS